MPLKPFTVVDLTHTLTADIPTWNHCCGFQHNITADYTKSDTETKFRNYQINMQAGIGTHIDAPCHCIPGATGVSDLSLDQLIAPCVVIDVSTRSHERYVIPPKDIEVFEQEYGQICEGSFVILHTGWDKFWHDPVKYRNNLNFPSISDDAAKLLLTRNILGLGIDTLSPDHPESGFPVHRNLLGANKYIIENIANAGSLPPVGAYTLALPIKIKDGTEAPIRLIGMIFNF